MDFSFKPFLERCNDIRFKTKHYIKMQTVFQQIIDVIRFNTWFIQNDKSTGSLLTSNITGNMYFKFENINIDDFIENILGRLHRKFGYLWEMEIMGDKHDPVFNFRSIRDYKNVMLYFDIKEGEFKQCRIEEVITEPEEIKWEQVKRSANKELRLVCE